MVTTAGLVLAAGGGARFGRPKALVRDASGASWLGSAVRALREGGCDDVVVVLGAEADAAGPMVPAGVRAVVADHWRSGMAASLRVGLEALPEADAVVISLVDLPGLPAAAVERVLGAVADRADLARAAYAGVPGHPVVLGRDHWAAFRDSLHGDEGGRAWLEEHDVTHVECGDLFTGVDVDHR